MDRGGWDGLAAWRDDRMGEEGDLWHRAIIDPTLLDVVGPVRGLAVLDLACGNGYLTRRWARAGATRAVGIERSRPTIANARRRERDRPSGAVFLERDAAHLRGLSSHSFDLVVANMALMDIRNAEGAIREASRVLRPAGRFVFSLNHPCFDVDERSGWLVEHARDPRGDRHEVVARKVARYRDERAVRVPWDVGPGRVGWTTSFHRTIPTYARWLRAAGLAITRLEEPVPTDEAVAKSPEGRFLLEIPLHLVVEARPLPGLRPDGAVRRRGSRTSEGTTTRTSPRSVSGDRTKDSGSRRRGSRSGS